MPVEMRMWRIDGAEPRALTASALPAEKDLHEFLKRDPSLLGERLLVIGSEVITPFGPRLDLLAIDAEGSLHLLELKRDKTPGGRGPGARLRLVGIDPVPRGRHRHRKSPPLAAVRSRLRGRLRRSAPDELNHDLHLTVVAAELDASSERIVNYLRTFGVPVNAVFFSYLEDDGRRYLARSWLAADEEESPVIAKPGKRAIWNGRDWYVNFGGGRPWDDARLFNFISAGGGKFYSQTIRTLPEGARIWVCVPDAGYVAVGTTLLPATRFEAAEVLLDGTWTPLAGQQLAGIYRHDEDSDDDNAEWVVPVVWSDSRPLSEAFWQKGMFASTHSACKLRQEFTLGLLETHFDVGDD